MPYARPRRLFTARCALRFCLIERGDAGPGLLRQRAPRILLHQQRVPLSCSRCIVQFVLVDLPFGQQRSHPQRATRILRSQKLILPHGRRQAFRIVERTPLFREQLRHRVHAIGSVHIPRRLVVHRAKPIHRLRVVGSRPRPFGNRLERLQSPLRLLPRRELCLALSCLRTRTRHLHRRAAQHHCPTPTPPEITNCLPEAHCLFQPTDSLSLREPAAQRSGKEPIGIPPDTPLLMEVSGDSGARNRCWRQRFLHRADACGMELG